jgi:hypothetical protein
MAGPGRKEIHTSDVKIEQKAPLIGDLPERAPEIVRAEQVIDKNYADELAFNEEPVTIRIAPSTEKNAARHIYCAVNGIGCEVWTNGQWVQMPYIPVAQNLTVKRKYIEVLIRAKKDEITTDHQDVGSEYIDNRVNRMTSAVAALSIVEDKNPRGGAWATELMRRNF